MAVPGEISQKKDEFGAGPEDAFLIPLVTAALALKVLGKLLVSMLINVLDFTFPLVIQLVRFPLFTARILGDTAVAVGKLAVSVLPIPEQARIDWRRGISEKWSALRPRISYGAFEEAVHHLFDDGMAWVFRKCRKLSPRQAVWLIAAAALWLPVSFGIATAMHASLLLYAAVLPAWMQLLHPVATFFAKSKLLVLPVYPAAWPQAKQDPFVQSLSRGYGRFRSFHLIRKTGYRYRQMELVRQEINDAFVRACARAGVTHASGKMWNATVNALAWPVKIFHSCLRAAFSNLSQALLIGPVLRSYAAHYAAVEQCKAQRTSERVSGLFQEWSIKFSAEYYERKERQLELRAEAEPAVSTAPGAPGQIASNAG